MVPLPSQQLQLDSGDLITTGCRIFLQEINEENSHDHYMTVDCDAKSRWNVNTEALEPGQLEMFEVVHPMNFLEVIPIWEDDMIYLKTWTGHYLVVDTKTGWLYGDARRGESSSVFCFTKDSGIRSTTFLYS